MFFYYTTPEYIGAKGIYQVKKVRAYLRTGIIEIYEDHKNLMGSIKNNLIEIENTEESIIKKTVFFVQNGVLVVSRDGYHFGEVGTTTYLYAKDIKEIRKDISISKIEKDLEEKNRELQKAISDLYESRKNFELEQINLDALIFVLKQDVLFLSSYAKTLKTYKF